MSISPEKIAAHKLAADRLWIIKKLAEQIEQLGAENKALRRKNERLREALKLALNSHGRMLMSDPPQDAWKFHRVDEVIVAALRREET